MPHTLAELIIGHAAGREVNAGDLAVVNVDMAMGHDSLAPSIIDVMQKELGQPRVKDVSRVVIFMDHVAPASSVATAENQARTRRFVAEQDICNFFDVGRGVCHQVMLEEGLAQPGQIVLGADSHTNSYWRGLRLWNGHGFERRGVGLGQRPYLAARARDDLHPGERQAATARHVQRSEPDRGAADRQRRRRLSQRGISWRG